MADVAAIEAAVSKVTGGGAVTVRGIAYFDDEPGSGYYYPDLERNLVSLR